MPSGVVYFTLCINIAKFAVRVYIFAVTCHYAKLPEKKLATPYRHAVGSRRLNRAGVIYRAPEQRSPRSPLYMFGGEILHQHFSAAL